KLPPHRGDYDFAINFKEGAELPKPVKIYGMSPIEKRTLEEWLEKELADGKIRESKNPPSPVASPVFYIPKADGSRRLVVDYRRINDITIPDQFPMPQQEDLIEQLKDAKIFTKLDLRWGFNNIRVKEGDKWKTAF